MARLASGMVSLLAVRIKDTVAVATVAAAAAGLAGCVTTQERNARTVLLDERTLATETPVRVTRENPLVRVGGIALIYSGAAVRVAVQVVNTSPRPLTDLPISIGVLGPRGRRVYLNGAESADYYSAHVASIAARDQVTWVSTTDPRAPAGFRPFAVVGVAHVPPSTTVRTLPRIVATAQRPLADRVRVTLSNQSGVPQYGLQVYAVATRSGQAVAVGRATVAQLGNGARLKLSLIMMGRASNAAVRVYALPTIFS